MQKFIVKVVVALVVLCGAGFYVYKTNDVNETYENNEIKNNSNMLSMMLETSAGSGEYQKTSASTWPTEGYVFNESLSKCEKGSSLSWDYDKKQVIFEGNSKDDCYIYFDKSIPLSNYVISQYTKIQGENNLYFHDSNLENGAKDGSYRYAGSSETTNNFVCFGYDSTDGTCPTDYLYRIIGVFDNEVKLVKYDYAKSSLLGTDGDYVNTYELVGWGMSTKGNNILSDIGAYYWNTNASDNLWSKSKLNIVNLNINYLNHIESRWKNLISTHTWKVGGNTWDNIILTTVVETFKNEITSPATNITYDAKIGLMYVSDYGYAASPSAWGIPLFNNNENDYRSSNVTSVNWLYMGLSEWTVMPSTSLSTHSYFVSNHGYVECSKVNYPALAIRPVFYLEYDVSYGGGIGTKIKPIIIK